MRTRWILAAVVAAVLLLWLLACDGGTVSSGDTLSVSPDDETAAHDFSADTGVSRVAFRVISSGPPPPYQAVTAVLVRLRLQLNYLLGRTRSNDSLTLASRQKLLGLADSVDIIYRAVQDSLLTPPPDTTPPAPVVATVTVAPATFAIAVGGTGVQLTATPKDAGGTAIPGKTVTWGSTATAAVSQTGFVIGISAGAATVTATVDGVGGSAAGTITAPTTVVVAELPRVTPSSAIPPCPNGDITVASGGNLQSALNTAVRGQCVVMDSTAKFIAPANGFVLPAKAGTYTDGYVTLTSNGHCPARGVRIDPAVDSVRMATIENAPNGIAPAIYTASASHGWWLRCFHVTQNQSYTTYANGGNILLGDGSSAQNTLASIPQGLGVDHMYIISGPIVQTKRCIAWNAGLTVVVDSYIAGCAQLGQDGGNAMGGWNAQGPALVENNYMEAPGEAFMMGGADPAVPDLTASDITFRKNYMYARMEWKSGPLARTKKNTFELKNAQRVLVEGNVLRNNWLNAQGPAAMIVMGSVNQSGSNQHDTDGSHCPGGVPGCTYSNPLVGCTWCKVFDITWRNNWFDSTSSLLNLFQGYATTASTHTRRIVFYNNLATNVGLAALINGGPGRVFGVSGPIADAIFDHNTGPITNNTGLIFGDGTVVVKDRFTFTNNIIGGGPYNVFSSFGQGTTAFNQFAGPGGSIANNVFIGATSGYPSGSTLIAANLAAALTTVSPKWRPMPTYAGKGADIAAIEAACGCVIP